MITSSQNHVNDPGEKPSKANYDGLSVEQVAAAPRRRYEDVPIICRKFCSRVPGSTLWDDIISGLAELRERARRAELAGVQATPEVMSRRRRKAAQ